MRSGADTLKRVTLELGGKSPNIVFADADFERGRGGQLQRHLLNQGEICSAGSRVLEEQSVYDYVLQAMVDRASEVRLGDGLDDDTTMGPLISKEATAARRALHRDRPAGGHARDHGPGPQ